MEIEVDLHINFIIIFCYNFALFNVGKGSILRGCVGGYYCACKEIENRWNFYKYFLYFKLSFKVQERVFSKEISEVKMVCTMVRF